MACDENPAGEDRLFLDRAIHDLRSQLRQTRAAAELLSESAGASETLANPILGQILEGTAQMDRILTAMGRYSTALHTQNYALRRVNTEAALQLALASLRDPIRRSGAEVTHGALPSVEGDLDRLAEVFEHLIGNALAYKAQDPPRIDIRGDHRQESWVLSVRDNGIGIDLKYASKVFAPFFRLHGPEIPGVGLGLTISSKIVEAHNGRMWFESGAGPGVTFFFTLPAVESEAAAA